MIRVGGVSRAWSNDFLKYDELLLPIMLDEAAHKDIRIKAATYAYRSSLLTREKSDSCIEAIEKGIKLFTAEEGCFKSSFKQTFKPLSKPEF
jgi:hypothetical protein